MKMEMKRAKQADEHAFIDVHKMKTSKLDTTITVFVDIHTLYVQLCNHLVRFPAAIDDYRAAGRV